MQIYNSMTRKKEPFVPLHEGKVGIYACGPTVYNFFHIGNARPFIVFDVLRRYLEYRGYEVTFVQNFTDIDDKMIRRANEEGVTVAEIAERYIAEYFTDAKALGIRPATVHPRATEHIPQIIALIQRLIDKGLAYESQGDVYYRVRAFPSYGCLCGQNLEDLESGARVSVDEVKEDPLDFALWKAQKPGEPAWESPWGMGRPGWHIECSAMSTTYLGETFDIHGGGKDLLFPHHENEIAQTSGATGKPYVRYWMHNGFINIDNEKMSKSKGNFFTVRDISREFDLEAVRLFVDRVVLDREAGEMRVAFSFDGRKKNPHQAESDGGSRNCRLAGHALELPYCSSMDALFDIVEDDYAVFIDPWYVPYWVYGFGALGMTFVLEPLKERIIARRKTLAGALAEMFVIAVFLSMAMELAFGLLVNQPDATGTYPYWDNSKLPLNVLQQAWLVNDVFIGFAALV